ncbi:hypothetical protein NG885_15265 [Enterococcus faecium]|uniref:hypothetical protein n=1 Tax=Enterococcus faecium TaxID=1352 RepID=UPI00209151BB|nr:hypothetical protein [Enterococcus faecium]MCO5533008.1 hypothetical protein [Enterococcus faecium]
MPRLPATLAARWDNASVELPVLGCGAPVGAFLASTPQKGQPQTRPKAASSLFVSLIGLLDEFPLVG